MQLERAMRFRYIMFSIVTSFKVSYDGRYYNRAILYVFNSTVYFRVKKKENDVFVVSVFLNVPHKLIRHFFVKKLKYRPKAEESLKLFIDYMIKDEYFFDVLTKGKFRIFYWDYPDEKDNQYNGPCELVDSYVYFLRHISPAPRS